MKRTSNLILAFIVPLLAWSGTAYAVSCQNGKTLYNKVVAGLPSCGDANCHKSNLSANNIEKGANNPGVIDSALNSVSEMSNVRSNLGLTSSDLDDLAQWLFFAPNCPAAAPTLTASPASVAFGTFNVGTSSAAVDVTVTNSGAGNATGLTYNTINSEFAVTKTCAASLAAGASCTITFRYTPTNGGTDNATYTITGGGGLSISLSGTGAATVTPANLQIAPSTAGFGSITVGSSSNNSAFTVTNSGGTAASGVAFANSNSSEFVVSGNTCGTTIGAGANCSLSIRYTPSAAGTDNASLTVSYAGGSAVVLSMSGTGVTVTTPPPPPPPPTVTTVDLIEYYHAAFGHYFVTYLQGEISKLDDGTFAGWARTGLKFKAWTAPGTGLSPVCRFFTTAFPPKSSHFYTPNAPECTVVKTSSVWGFEGEVFYTQNPDVGGNCPVNTVPVYRMYNNGQSGAPNHRYTTDFGVRAQMIAESLGDKKWIPEGAGTIGVIMCSPP
jgi:hypothetical protein